MKNRLQMLRQTGWLALFLSFSLGLKAQFSFTPPPQTVYLLDSQCKAVFDFNGQPPTVTSTIGANILTPPTGVDPVQTGYAVGDMIMGETTINVAFVAADDQGNTQTFFFDIFFIDETGPVFLTPTPATLVLDCYEDFPGPVVRQAIDSCDMIIKNVQSADLSLPPGSSVCSTADLVYRIWSVSDNSANFTIDTQLIIINPDLTPPTIGVQPMDATVNCTNNTFALWLNTQRNLILLGASDNCDQLTLTDNAPPAASVQCGDTEVTFTLTDGCGLSATTSATYTVIDTVAPVFSAYPANFAIACDDPIPQPPTLTASDNCDNGLPPIQFTQTTTKTNTGACTDYNYTISRTWSVSDACGNTESHTQVITVQDLVPPTFTAPADTTIACNASILPGSTGQVINPSDNCSSSIEINFIDSVDTLSCPQNTKINRVWIVRDACGNAATKIQQIFLIDTVPPTFTPPIDTLTVDCADALDFSVTGMPANVADQCGDAQVTNQDVIFDQECTHTYKIQRLWLVEDACGNADSALQIIIVRDTIAPVFSSYPADAAIACDDPLPAPPAITATDNCDTNLPPIQFMESSTQTANGSCSDHNYTVTRTWSVSDACGNMVSHTQTITVSDTEGPTFTLPADTTIACDAVSTPASTGQVTNLADNCSVDIDLDFSDTIDTLDCPQNRRINREWTATDVCGNATSAVQEILLIDTVPPSFTPPIDTVFVECTDADDLSVTGEPTNIADQCGATQFSKVDILFDQECNHTYKIRRTWLVEDACGNVDSSLQIIIVRDTVAPVLSFLPADTTLSCEEMLPVVPNITATDNCDTNLPAVDFEETSTQTTTGACTDFSYTLTRTWTVSDDCGNETTHTQVITVQDLTAPTFDVPADTTINCDAPTFPAATGQVTNLADNCNSMVDLDFVDSIDTLSCPQNTIINRVWFATDVCGNATSAIQEIILIDTIAPVFTPPTDTLYTTCTEVAALVMTSTPTNIADQCGEAFLSNQDQVFDEECEHTYKIRRTWRVEDECGNADSTIQIIIVQDTVAPVFSVFPIDTSVMCTTLGEAETVFNAWVNANGMALASDDCTDAANIQWEAYNAGTTDAPDLTTPNCNNNPPGIFLSQAVDFFAVDACGNARQATATFFILDDEPPTIVSCPQNMAVSTDPGTCEAIVELNPPVVIDSCSPSIFTVTFLQLLPVTAQALPGEEATTPVDSLSFAVAVPATPTSATSLVSLVVNLNGVDAESPTEFFFIYGEDGSLLGQTNNTPLNCDDATTIINLDPAIFNVWAADGTVEITLVPNIPVGMDGSFAVNNTCPGAEVEVRFTYTATTPLGLRFEYSIDGGPLIPVSPITSITETFQVGNTPVEYFVTDCAGNTASCTFTLSVKDQEPPVIICPPNFSVTNDPGVCEATTLIPLPQGFSDNCSAIQLIEQQQPANPDASLFTFALNPNIGQYLAQDKSFTFSGLSPNAIDDVTLIVEILGDIDSLTEYVIIRDQDGNPLGTTETGQPHVMPGNCSTPLFASFTIPPATFNSWVNNGEVSFGAEVFDNFPIFGGPGLGINPCEPDSVTANGATDGVSYIRLMLQYETIVASYFATGATTIPSKPLNNFAALPEEVLNQGVTSVSYVLEDQAGNVDTCTFDITVIDNEPPVALCIPNIIEINPSGLVVDTIFPSDIDNGSFDNCGEIASLSVMPNIVGCDRIGDTVNVVLSVIDPSGNVSTCNTSIKVEGQTPMPSYFIGDCGNDTLFLFANAPIPPGGNDVYTYTWSGPNFFSNQPNPIIPNADGSNAGSYSVTIQGLAAGCTATGIIQVTIEDLPLTPVLTFGDDNICANQTIQLKTAPISGNSVQYRWFNGNAPNGTLIGTSVTPAFNIPGPHVEGDSCYYVIVVRDGCPSSPSASDCVQITGKPVATTNDEVIDVCEGGTVMLGTTATGVQYEWTGPNYFSTLQFPPPITNVSPLNDGLYQLTVFKNGCPSDPDYTVVNVLDRPPKPLVNNSTTVSIPVCVGDTLELFTNIQNATSYEWLAPNFQTFFTDTSLLIIDNATTNFAGPWKLVVYDGFCPSDTSSATIVYVQTLPSVTASSNSPVCENETLELSANSSLGATFFWNGPNSTTFQGPTPVVDPPLAGVYTVTATTQLGGCKSTATLTAVVKDIPQITAISNNAPACPDGPTNIQLCATLFPADDGTYQYAWSGGNFFSSDSCAIIPGATPASNGPYTLVVENGEGCFSEPATTNVNMGAILPTPAAPIASMSGPYCVGDEISLTTVDVYSGSSETYWWYLPGGGVIQTPSPTLSSQLLGPLGLTSSGQYTVLVEVNGCQTDTSAALQVTVNSNPVAAPTTNSPVCVGDVLELFSNYPPAPMVAYQWFGPSNFSASVPNPTVPNVTANYAGTYTLIIEDKGCFSSPVSTNVIVKPTPQTPAVANTGAVCIDDPNAELILSINPGTATPGATYTWFEASLGQISNPSASLVLVLNDFSAYAQGTYSFFAVANLNGCESSPSIPTSVTFSTIPPNAADAGPDIQICEGQSAVLTAVPPSVGVGHWELISGNGAGVVISNPDIPTTTVLGLTPGQIYLFEWSLSNGACVDYSSDQVQVTVDIFETANAGPNIDTCAATSVPLNATWPMLGTGSWSQPPAQAALNVQIANPNNPNTIVTGLVPGNEYFFTWTLSDNGCGGSSDEVIVRVIDDFSYAGDDYFECGDGCTQLNALAPEVGFGTWSSTNPAVTFSNPTDPEATACNLAVGVNTFVWIINNGVCGPAGTDSVKVTYKLAPVAVDDAYDVPFAGNIQFEVQVNDILPDDYSISIIQEPRHGTLEETANGAFIYQADINYSGSDDFIYELCSQGCECSTAIVTLTIGADATCDIPTIITPNNDNINDIFVVPCLTDGTRYPDNSVSIFNQWGDEVFRASPYSNNWAGTYSGEPLPSGTYFFVVDFGNGEAPRTGFLIIQQ